MEFDDDPPLSVGNVNFHRIAAAARVGALFPYSASHPWNSVDPPKVAICS